MKKKVLFATLVLSLLTFLTYVFLVNAVDFFISGSGSYYANNVVWETTLNGAATEDSLGISVATGDVNNDSYADVIVGASSADPSGTDRAGQAYVFFGTANGIFDMDATNANLTFNGTATNDNFGWSVGSGDVNNDSYADVIVAAYRADPSGAENAGQVYVFFGADYSSATGISYNAGTDANLTFNGTAASDAFGGSVGSGDVNNDSYFDVIVGATGADPSGADGAGQAYVFFGADYPNAVTISYNATEDANLTFNGTKAGDLFGNSVASGDVNNDSYADIIVGAYYAPYDVGGDSAGPGQAFVFFGADYPNAVTISYNALIDANLTINGTAVEDYFGWSVGSGDVNNDSYFDVIVGAYKADIIEDWSEGQAYVFFGADYTSTVSQNALSSANLTFNGTKDAGYFGYSVGSGDVNNDSYADIIVGAWQAGAGYVGQAYVFFGADYTSTINQDALSSANLTFNSTAVGNYFGASVATGDVNNDSYADVIVGAWQAPCVGGLTPGTGQVYIYAYDVTNPVVMLDGPSSGSTDGDGEVSFTFTATDYHPDSCSLYINSTLSDWAINDSVSFSSNTQGSIAINLTDATYTWNIKCNDTAGNSAFNDTNYTIVVSNDAPVVYLDGPSSGSTDGDGEVNFTFTTVETYPDVCSLYINSTLSDWAVNASVSYSNNTQGSISVNLTDATYTWSMECNDTVGKSAFNDTNYTITVTNSAPSVTLNSPSDNSYDTDGLDVVFNFTTTETYPERCTLFFRSNATNWGQNETIDYSNNTQHNFSSLNLTDAAYVWNVECNDTANNPAFASANYTLTVDTVVPVTPTVTEPSNTNINPRGSISYTCESSDVTAGISKWTWTLTRPPDGGTVTKTGGAVTSNTQAFSGDDTNLAGTYTVKCEAEDKAGHKSSSSKTFAIYYSHHVEASSEGPSAAAELDLSTQEELTIKEKQGTITTFTLDGTTVHTIKIKTVDEVAGTVTIVIESDPITITLKIGETEEVDVDADGVNDISVTLNGITKGVADITTKRLTPLPKKEVPTEEVPPTEKPTEEVTPTVEAASKTWQWILVTVIVVVIGVGYWFMKKKK